MAGYFSNHSQSRFLANSTGSASTAGNTNGGGGSHASSGNATTTAASTNAKAAPRSRVLSRQFSTTVASSGGGSASSSGDERMSTKASKEKMALAGALSVGGTLGSAAGAGQRHPLRHTWVFWFRQHRAPGNKIVNYEEGIKKVSTFGSIESFWSLWTHLNPPSTLQPTTDYILFHSGVRRPVWEDTLNLHGGKWILRLKKGVADRLWEDLVMAIVGDQFSDCGAGAGENGLGDGVDAQGSGGVNGKGNGGGSDPEICGCMLSVRQSEDVLSIWNRDGTDVRVRQRIRETVRKVLNLSPTTAIEYKTNNESMQDKPVFRHTHTSTDRAALQ